MMTADDLAVFSECFAGWLIVALAVYTIFGYIWFPKWIRQAVQEDKF